MKQKPKKDLSIRQEIRHLGVIIEHVDSNVTLVAEQHGDIKKTLDAHTEILNSHTEMIAGLKVDMEIVKTDVAELKTDVAGLKTDMSTVKSDISGLKTDIEIVKTDVEFIKGGLKKKVDIDEFAALERRVALLEKRR